MVLFVTEEARGRDRPRVVKEAFLERLLRLSKMMTMAETVTSPSQTLALCIL